jgi:allantoinase
LKAFMSNSGIDDFQAVDEQTLRGGMKRAAELGLLVAVHAESEEMTRDLAERAMASGRTSIRDYLASRPVAAELEAIRRAVDLAAETGCKLHIVHVSSGSGVALVAEARAQGVDVTCETCPHYLLLTEDDMVALGAVAKCAPPLRSAEEQRRLWRRLSDVDTIGSDHSPSAPQMKTKADFFRVWGGISGCQHLLALLLDRASPTDIARLTASGVACRFALANKGSIMIGNDADLTIVDTRAEETIAADSLHYRHRQSPFVGRRTRARIVRTVLRGQTIFADGSFPARSFGKFVQPARQL